MDEIVTIVIPTYKRPDRVRRAVLSAISQTYQPLEIIVVDDNGNNTDDALKTFEALEDLVENKIISYFCNDVNRGGSYSRNIGLSNSHGDYITFLDDDDEIESTKIERQVDRLNILGNAYGAVYTGYKKILESGKIHHSNEKVEGDVFKYALSRSIYVGSGSNLLVRKKIAMRINGYDVDFKRNQDLEFMTRVLKNTKLAYVDDELLTIHYEIREIKRSYQELIEIDEFYVNKFKEDILSLGPKDSQDVFSIIALERFKYSLFKNVVDGTRNLYRTKVKFIVIIKYTIYLIDRIINSKSYGFKL